MKKISFYALPFLAAAVLVTSCKKDEETPGPSTPATATIKGAAFAQLNDTTAEFERAPQGTVITALIDPDDLMVEPDTNMVSDKVRVTTTVDANGNYTLTVRARNAEVPVQIIADDFEYEQIKAGNTKARKVYTAPDRTVNVVAGTTTITDITYN